MNDLDFNGQFFRIVDGNAAENMQGQRVKSIVQQGGHIYQLYTITETVSSTLFKKVTYVLGLSNEPTQIVHRVAVDLTSGTATFPEHYLKEAYVDYARKKIEKKINDKSLLYIDIGLSDISYVADTACEILSSRLKNCSSFEEVDVIVKDLSMIQVLQKCMIEEEKSLLKLITDEVPLTSDKILDKCNELAQDFPNYVLLKCLKSKANLWREIQSKEGQEDYPFEDVWKWGFKGTEADLKEVTKYFPAEYGHYYLLVMRTDRAEKKRAGTAFYNIEDFDDLIGSLQGTSDYCVLQEILDKNPRINLVRYGLTKEQARELYNNLLAATPVENSFSIESINKDVEKVDYDPIIAKYLVKLEEETLSNIPAEMTADPNPNRLLLYSAENWQKNPNSIIWGHIHAKAALWNEIKKEYPDFPFNEIWKWRLESDDERSREEIGVAEYVLLIESGFHFERVVNKIKEDQSILSFFGCLSSHTYFSALNRNYNYQLWNFSHRMKPLGLSPEQQNELELRLVNASCPHHSKMTGKEIEKMTEKLKPMQLVSRYLLELEEKMVPQDIRKDPVKAAEYFNSKLAEQPDFVIWRKLAAEANAWTAMQRNPKLRGYPMEEIWRFGIDGKYEDLYGPYYFENEPRFIEGWLKGLTKAVNTNHPISSSDYVAYHDTIIENMKKFVGGELVTFPFGLRTSRTGFGIGFGSEWLDQDPHGLEDLKRRGEPKGVGLGPIDSLHRNLPQGQFIFSHDQIQIDHNSVEPPQEWLDKVFTIYNSKIENPAIKPEERLLAALWLVRELEINHVFVDANGRSSIVALLGILANDPDLPMALFHDPNILDVNGPEKLCYRCLEAMINFRNNGLNKNEPTGKETLSLKNLQNLDPIRDADIIALRDRLIPLVEDKPWMEIHEWITL